MPNKKKPVVAAGGFYSALGVGDSSSSVSAASDAASAEDTSCALPPLVDVDIPPYEDLSTGRADEETVLKAIYESDFTSQIGAWECPLWQIQVRPPNVMEKAATHQGSQLLLKAQLTKQYPYVMPRLELANVRGLSLTEQAELSELLQQRGQELASVGQVMMIDLVQVAEEYLQDHDFDPTASAWDEMQKRQQSEREQAEQAQRAMARIMMDSSTNASLTEQSSALIHNGMVSPVPSTTHLNSEDRNNQVATTRAASSYVDIEREVQRQRDALATAQRIRRGDMAVTSSDSANDVGPSVEDDDEYDDDEIDFDADDYDGALAVAGSSRYQSDFVELGLLGRGGGGEVVKVRNRLDRRIYAVKKIVLESERGPQAGARAQQNRKLRREVTTISRMMHKNIVRYYQAWVEGDVGSASEMDRDQSVPATTSYPSESKLKDSETNVSSSEEGSNDVRNWWRSSPFGNDNTGLSGSWSEASTDRPSTQESLGRRGGEVVVLQNPLYGGIGLPDKDYGDLVPQKGDILPSQDDASESSHIWDDSSVKVDQSPGRGILYIQMEYCATTLRHLIDERKVAKMDDNEKWRIVRQMLEALVYIHGRSVIHRDLKPSNIFIDSNSDIRIGDLGLATRRRKDANDGRDTLDGIGDAANLIDSVDPSASYHGDAVEALTGGVGTTFYRAPEQEAVVQSGLAKGQDTYNTKADIYSFGIILFEMWHPPFSTYMERAETLAKLQADSEGRHNAAAPLMGADITKIDEDVFALRLAVRFHDEFVNSVPRNLLKIMLWCLEKDPWHRPSAQQLLSSGLLPRKIELEQKYLEEALEILTSSQTESHLQILEALFARPMTDVIELTFDTDVAVRAGHAEHDGRTPLSQSLLLAISDIRAGAVDLSALRSLAMSPSSLAAAAAALKRARFSGRLGKGGKGMLKRSTQRLAGVLAMRAATSAAVTGQFDGIHGSDPRVIDFVSRRCREIFRGHGAVNLASPLLRPRLNLSEVAPHGGPAEYLSTRGAVLLLPEDLTISFARSLGRGGAATSHLKRFEIDRVYHKSVAGGHPRETLEASFDVIHEDHAKASILQAETLFVCSQVLSVLPRIPLSPRLFAGQTVQVVPWFIKVTNTRLSDALLELCRVPAKESLRQLCCSILSRFTVPSPQHAVGCIVNGTQLDFKDDEDVSENLRKTVRNAVAVDGLPAAAADRLELFVKQCMPLPLPFEDAIAAIANALALIVNIDGSNGLDARRARRFEDAARCLKALRELMIVSKAFLEAYVEVSRPPDDESDIMCRPLYIAIDLGLRQKRKHYNGGLFYQCFVLHSSFFSDNPPSHSPSNSSSARTTKVGEGGDYVELVRRYRPPGNFATSVINEYTTAPIPMCTGVRFSLGKLVELLYQDPALGWGDVFSDWNPNEQLQRATHDRDGMEILRRTLGHPLHLSNPPQCIVASAHGLDSGSTAERFQVCCKLWAAGVSAEYLPQSGMILSLVKRINADDSNDTGSSDWSLVELVGVCALLKIPFLVIVQAHLLKDKGAVRLRRINADTMSQSHGGAGGNEMFVLLDNLATMIKEDTGPNPDAEDDLVDPHGTPSGIGTNESSGTGGHYQVDCILIDNDVYYGSDREISRIDTLHWKGHLKSMKKVELAADSFLSSSYETPKRQPSIASSIPVFAADVSFWALRDFGTAVMRRESSDQSAQGAFAAVAEQHARFKRPLKTLATALDTYMKRHGIWQQSGSHNNHPASRKSRERSSSLSTLSNALTVLLYSKLDDRFDTITLAHAEASESGHAWSRPTSKPPRK